MAGLDALQLIQDALAQPLPDDETRRVVSCLDVAGSSGEGFDRLMESGIGCELMRSLTFEKVEEGFNAIRDLQDVPMELASSVNSGFHQDGDVIVAVRKAFGI